MKEAVRWCGAVTDVGWYSFGIKVVWVVVLMVWKASVLKSSGVGTVVRLCSANIEAVWVLWCSWRQCCGGSGMVVW